MASGYPLALRVQNALLSLARYLGKTLWPQDLAVVYPFPWRGVPAWQWAAAALLLLAITAAAVRWRRRCPFVLWGWLWFLVTLAPVIGLVQVGDQALADRYTYIPHVGLLVMAVWGLRELARGRPRLRVALAALAVAALAALPALTQRQVGVWRDGVTLFTHARAATAGNWVAEINLGMYFMNKGEKAKAIERFRETIRVRPNHVRGHFNLGVALYETGSLEEAVLHYRQALMLDPNFGEAHCNLGVILLMGGRTEEAVFHFREALRANPRDEIAAGNLERALRGRSSR
jgi:tetratricopeptide (TPR) repeat protein